MLFLEQETGTNLLEDPSNVLIFYNCWHINWMSHVINLKSKLNKAPPLRHCLIKLFTWTRFAPLPSCLPSPSREQQVTEAQSSGSPLYMRRGLELLFTECRGLLPNLDRILCDIFHGTICPFSYGKTWVGPGSGEGWAWRPGANKQKSEC